jgi:hypothetical protein
MYEPDLLFNNSDLLSGWRVSIEVDPNRSACRCRSHSCSEHEYGDDERGRAQPISSASSGARLQRSGAEANSTRVGRPRDRQLSRLYGADRLQGIIRSVSSAQPKSGDRVETPTDPAPRSVASGPSQGAAYCQLVGTINARTQKQPRRRFPILEDLVKLGLVGISLDKPTLIDFPAPKGCRRAECQYSFGPALPLSGQFADTRGGAF